MQQRVNIALALACDPKLIIADEPTSSLDPTVAQSLTSLFRELAQTKTLLIITHDLGLVKHCANQVLVFYSGQIVEVAPPDLFFTSPKMPYSQALLQASQFDKESIAAFDKADEAPAAIGALANKLDAQPIACGVPTSGCRFANRCVLQIQECLTQPIVLKGTLKSTMQNLEKDAEKETVKDTTQHHYRCIL
jgi:ABC-type dipeptide/oligopeptide/nickel transport system ATPase component